MTSERLEPQEAYVWAWLPGATDPVVVGLLEGGGGDRPAGGGRRLIVSALTMLGIGEMDAAFASSYADLAAVIRARFTDPTHALIEAGRSTSSSTRPRSVSP